jgi:hypothetical protein
LRFYLEANHAFAGLFLPHARQNRGVHVQQRALIGNYGGTKLKDEHAVARVARPKRSSSPKGTNRISIVDVEITLEALRSFLVGGVFHQVELTTLLVEHCARLNFTGTLLHRRIVLGRAHLALGRPRLQGLQNLPQRLFEVLRHLNLRERLVWDSSLVVESNWQLP